MINEILEANLKEIKRYNPSLVNEIKNIDELINDIKLVETNLNEPNLVYNDRPIHSQDGAEIEAKIIFNNSINETNRIHIIFGLGLGYLFKEFCENSKGRVILYEPEVEILRTTLEIVDFSKELAQKNVYIASNIDSLQETLQNIYANNDKLTIHFLDFHRNNFSSNIDKFKDSVSKTFSIIAFNKDFIRKNIYNFFKYTIDSLDKKITIPPFSILENKFKDFPAIIISAGPSLSKNIQTLKKIQNKAIIFCVGTAYKTLVKNNIKPDFLNAIEMYDCSTQLDTNSTEKINFISEAYTNKAFYDMKFNNKYLTLSKENMANLWYAGIINEDIELYETKGTVSYNALNCAKILGCNPIILLGQDLAYTDGKCYSDDSAYSSLKCKLNPLTNKAEIIPDNYEEYRHSIFGDKHPYTEDEQNKYIKHKLKVLNSSLAFVEGQNNDILPTEQGYAMFIEYFKDFAKRNNSQINLINASVGGAYIEGFNHMPLKEIQNYLKNCKPDINNILNNCKREIDIKVVLDNIENELKLINKVYRLIRNEEKNLQKCKNIFLIKKKLTEESNNYIKSCLNVFFEISMHYKKNHYLIYAITHDDDLNVNKLLKDCHGNLDFNTQSRIIKQLGIYFENSLKKLDFIEEQLASKIKIINNSLK